MAKEKTSAVVENEIITLKKIMKDAKNGEDISQSLEILYERISNKPEANYHETYDLIEICKAKVIAHFWRRFKKEGIIAGFEVIKYDVAPQKIIISYNEDDKIFTRKWEMYILKE